MTPRWHEQYAWGYASYGKWGYFGTGEIVCSLGYFGELIPFATKKMTCEWGKGTAAPVTGPFFGDIFQAQVYRVDSDTDQVQRICCDPNSADPVEAKAAADMQYPGGGIRGGGAILPPPGVKIPGLPEGHGVMMMYAPALETRKTLDDGSPNPAYGRYNALTMVAFDADTGKVLGSIKNPNYVGIRRTQNYNGWMYASARTTNVATPGVSGGGAVLKWNPISTEGDTVNLENLFNFDTVFRLPAAGSQNDAQHIGLYQDKLVLLATTNFVGTPATTPGYGITNKEGSQVWLSPSLDDAGPGGLTAAGQDGWKSIFNYKDFDPDTVRGLAHPLGWAEEFDGQLVFGTYSTPPMTMFTHYAYYHPGAPVAAEDYRDLLPDKFTTIIRDFFNSEKAVSVFAIKNAGEENQSTRVLYGNYRYPVYNGKTWKMKVNRLGQRPKFGSAGYGNFINEYSWTWVKHNDRLYMGTFDATNPGQVMTPLIQQVLDLTNPQARFVDVMMEYSAAVRREAGFDLLRFDDLDHPARIETVRGYGNSYNWGLRSFMGPFGDKFYMGSAGTQNRVAGWSIFKLTPNENAPVGRVRRRAVLESIIETTMYALEAGTARGSQAGRGTVRAGQPANFNVKLRNRAPLPVTGARVCIKPPAGFTPAAGSGAKRVGRRVCVAVGRVPAKGSKTVVVRMIAGDRSRTGTATATVTGRSWAGGCGGLGAMLGAAKVGASQANSDDNCQEKLATTAGFKTDAAAAAKVRVRPAAGAPRGGGVTG